MTKLFVFNLYTESRKQTERIVIKLLNVFQCIKKYKYYIIHFIYIKLPKLPLPYSFSGEKIVGIIYHVLCSNQCVSIQILITTE